ILSRYIPCTLVGAYCLSLIVERPHNISGYHHGYIVHSCISAVLRPLFWILSRMVPISCVSLASFMGICCNSLSFNLEENLFDSNHLVFWNCGFLVCHRQTDRGR